MKTLNIYDELKSNSYPGRGIVIGKSADGKSAVTAYFIMGRSVNSRNRIFTETEDGIKTEAADPSKLSDPHLIIYSLFVCLETRLSLQTAIRRTLSTSLWTSSRLLSSH